jgi:AraC-like DNA-binding protein
MSNAAHSHVKHLKSAPDGRKLTPAHKAVLSQLADDHNEDQGVAWPSVGHLARRACMSREYCRRLLRELESMGIIEANARLRENGGRASSEYRFCLMDPPFDAKKKADIVKRLRYQEIRRQQRAVQMSLAPSQLGLEGGTATEVRNHTEIDASPSQQEEDVEVKVGDREGNANPGWSTPPTLVGDPSQLELKGTPNDGGGAIEPVLEPPTEPEAEPLPEPSPQPPGAGGARLTLNDDEPLLPFPAARPGEAGWAVSVDVAARWLAEKLGIVAQRRVLPVLIEALTLRVKEQSRETLHEVARMAANNWRVYQRDIHLVKRPWGPVNFFKLGHWQRPRTWFDAELVAQHRAASVGVGAPTVEPATDSWSTLISRIRREIYFSLGNAERVEALTQFEAGIRPTELRGREMDGDVTVLMVVSPDPERTMTAIALLRKIVGRETRHLFGGAAQWRVISQEEGES